MSELATEPGHFPEPREPDCLRLYAHAHEWIEVGAKRNPNRTWTSAWACKHCPDIGGGGLVGPIPDWMCGCGFVNEPDAKKCSDCKGKRIA